MIHVAGKYYELIQDHKNGWNAEAFRDRYSEVLDRFDYIVGDWGYNQLRLKGFLRDNHPKVTKDSSVSAIADYLHEYCNFGCAYFILEKSDGKRKGELADKQPSAADTRPQHASASASPVGAQS